MVKPIIIDCDPGIDDALAILLAAASEQLDLKLITTCAGNQTSEKITANALKLLSFIERPDIPVARGATHPLHGELVVAEKAHGDSGFGGVELGETTLSVIDQPAIDAMRDVILASDQKVTIIAIGPLTNVAKLLQEYPEIAERIEELSIMGGSSTEGNATPVAEFNIYVDPEAARIVFRSGVPITMFGLNVTYQVPMYIEDINRIRNIGNQTGQAIAAMLDFYFRNDRVEGMHDPCAVAYLIDPSLFETKLCNVEIEVSGEFTRGQTVVDLRGRTSRDKNANVAVGVSSQKLLDMLYEAVKTFK
ncbi:pyrimidine-specific ribonucleoside hydrolase RihA [Paenibacillus sp. YSY-4.3]